MEPKETGFNDKVNDDFRYVERSSALHMVDNAAQFSTEIFAEFLTKDPIWETALSLWVAIYTGLSNIFAFDDESQLRDTCLQNLRHSDVEL